MKKFQTENIFIAAVLLSQGKTLTETNVSPSKRVIFEFDDPNGCAKLAIEFLNNQLEGKILDYVEGFKKARIALHKALESSQTGGFLDV